MDYKRGTRIVMDEDKIRREGKYDLDKVYQNIDELAEYAGLIKKNKYVGFELDTSYKLITSNLPCNHSAIYQSIIGNGKVSFVEDEDEKKLALRMIMEHSTGKKDWQFTDSMVSSVCVFKLEVLEISGKENL